VRVLLKADWVVDRELNVYRDGYVVVEGGRISGTGSGLPEGDFDERINIKGCIYPPFVNAHCHLELSSLKFDPEAFASFFDWLVWIIGNRQKLSFEEISGGVRSGIGQSERFGTALIGDISSFGISPDYLERGVVYSEIIGRDADLDAFRKPLSVHSVYSVSASLIKKVADDALEKGYRFQIHLGEVKDEERFVRGERNRFEEVIYPIIGRKRFDRVYAEDVVSYLEKIGALNENLIAVHCTNLSGSEVERLMERGCGIVLCPRSNVHLHTGFPNFKFFEGYENLAIGTDGLSSNTSLSIVSELKTLYYRLEGSVKLRELLRIATVGGLNVLSLDRVKELPIFTVCHTGETVDDPFIPILMDGVRFGVVDLRVKK